MSKNPFSISFGTEPLNYVDRVSEKHEIIEDINDDFPSNHATIIVGPRGCGKTVFMTSICNDLSKEEKWLVVDPGPKNNILENIASEIYESSKNKFHFVKGEFSFSFKGITFSLKGDKPVSTVNTLLKKMLDVLKKKKIKVLITIDEVDNSADMKYFIQEFQSLIRLNYPIRLLMTGLYENVSKLQDDKSLTFLYRAKKVYLSALYIGSISSQYENYLSCDKETSIKLAKLTKGYAFAFQALGYILFKENKKDVDNNTILEFDHYLAEYVYDKIFYELTSNEQKIVQSIKTDENVKLKDIKTKTKISDSLMSLYKNNLIKKGVLTSNSYGTVCFALPRFSNYLEYK